MSFPVFNGWTIIDPPTTPGFRGIVLRMNDTVAETRSPFSAQAQQQLWPGADWWEAEIEMPPLQPLQTAAWQSWFAALQGKTAVFQLGDPSRPQPQNPVHDSIPVCATGTLPSAVNLPGATALVTRGWLPNQKRLLLPGCYLQVGYRLHMVQWGDVVCSDAGGNATITVWPTLREQPADATPVILNNPKGLFRLAANDRQVSIAVTGLAAAGFKCVEAR
jgi:hypothetical protein